MCFAKRVLRLRLVVNTTVRLTQATTVVRHVERDYLKVIKNLMHIVGGQVFMMQFLAR